jgi:hypothetical protein
MGTGTATYDLGLDTPGEIVGRWTNNVRAIASSSNRIVLIAWSEGVAGLQRAPSTKARPATPHRARA